MPSAGSMVSMDKDMVAIRMAAMPISSAPLDMGLTMGSGMGLAGDIREPMRNVGQVLWRAGPQEDVT